MSNKVDVGLLVKGVLMHIFNSAASKNELVEGKSLSTGDIVVVTFDDRHDGQIDYNLFMVKEVLKLKVNLIQIGEDEYSHDDGYSIHVEEKVAVIYNYK